MTVKLNLICLSLVLMFYMFSSSSVHAGSCSEFEKAMKGGADSAYPRIKNGRVEAIVMYGEANAALKKRSLINKARMKADMRAKRAYSKWLEEATSSEEIVKDLTETAVETSGNPDDPEVKAAATELESIAETMKGSTKRVMSGLVRLDECVQGRRVMVEWGWKPSFGEAAADTSQKVRGQIKRGRAGSQTVDGKSNQDGKTVSGPTTKVTPTKDYRRKSTLKDGF